MSSTNIEFRWVKPPRQDRSRDTHMRYVEAAQRMLGDGKAFTEISVAELAKEASSSVGAFYSRFRDKDALLHVLQLELIHEATATATENLAIAKRADVPLDVLVRGFVTLAVGYYRQQAGLRRALLVEMGSNAELRARSIALSQQTCAGLVEVLAGRYPHATARLPTVIDVLHRMIYGALDQELTFAGTSPTGRALSDATLIDEISAAMHAYLVVRLAPQ